MHARTSISVCVFTSIYHEGFICLEQLKFQEIVVMELTLGMSGKC